jgi:hypothetical protein
MGKLRRKPEYLHSNTWVDLAARPRGAVGKARSRTQWLFGQVPEEVIDAIGNHDAGHNRISPR